MVEISELLKAVAEFLRNLARCIPPKAQEAVEVANTVANGLDPVPQDPK